ncbi:MAG: sulfate adenylyltransferase small subunit, partial [Bacteroidota bacterium]
YLAMENVPLPSLYYAHQRKVIRRDGILLADCDYIPKKPTEKVEELMVRCRTIGDMTCTGVWESNATDLEGIIQEVATARQTERGGRADDKRSETAMEDRKKQGYF